MKNKLITMLLPLFVDALLKSFDVETIKRTLDRLIDQLEDHILLSETKVDDVLLPAIYMLRNIFDIPDYLDEKNAPAASKKKA